MPISWSATGTTRSLRLRWSRKARLAARIASYAQAGQVVVSQETAQRSGDRQVWFDPLGAVDLKGVAKPLPLYQAYRRS
jgi:class 3 adenylate cyclase